MTCSIAACERAAVKLGMCLAHYTRVRRGSVSDAPIRQVGRHVEDRFWEKVSKTPDCWLWTAAVRGTDFKYGVLGVGSRPKWRAVGAHRISWQLHFGEIPRGAFVCHACDNPICVRPDHLFLGDALANARDMARKGRSSPQRHPEKYRGPRPWLRGERPPKECARCGALANPLRRAVCERCYDRDRYARHCLRATALPPWRPRKGGPTPQASGTSAVN